MCNSCDPNFSQLTNPGAYAEAIVPFLGACGASSDEVALLRRAAASGQMNGMNYGDNDTKPPAPAQSVCGLGVLMRARGLAYGKSECYADGLLEAAVEQLTGERFGYLASAHLFENAFIRIAPGEVCQNLVAALGEIEASLRAEGL